MSTPSRPKRPFYLSEVLMMAYPAAMSLVVATFFQSVPHWRPVLGIHLAMIPAAAAFFLWVRTVHGGAQMTLRVVFGLTWVLVAFGQLHRIVPFVNPHEFDANLLHIDERIFGLNPQEWIEQYYHPLLTEVLQVVYASYYFLPLALFIALGRRGRFAELEKVITCIVIGFVTAYALYLLVPARSPYVFAETDEGRYMLTYREELRGLLLTDKIRTALHHMERIKHDAFPSGHTEVTLIVLLLAWRWSRPVFWGLLPVATALVISTVYLRYHYVIDLIAGSVLAVVIVAWGPRLVGRWNRARGLPDDPTALAAPAALAPGVPAGS